MPLTLVTPPADEVVTLSEMSQHLKREDTTEDDEYIESLIAPARELIEQATGRAFIDQTWRLQLRDWPSSGFIRLPKSPLLEVVSVTYRDAAGAYQTLQQDVDFYVAEGDPAVLDPGDLSWPVTGNYPDAVSIVFRAGYIDSTGSPEPDGVVPAMAKHAIKALAAHWYANREPVETGGSIGPVVLPLHVERLIRSLRVYGDG